MIEKQQQKLGKFVRTSLMALATFGVSEQKVKAQVIESVNGVSTNNGLVLSSGTSVSSYPYGIKTHNPVESVSDIQTPYGVRTTGDFESLSGNHTLNETKVAIKDPYDYFFKHSIAISPTQISTFSSEYEHPVTGNKVILIGVHPIGDPSYYKNVENILNSCDFVIRNGMSFGVSGSKDTSFDDAFKKLTDQYQELRDHKNPLGNLNKCLSICFKLHFLYSVKNLGLDTASSALDGKNRPLVGGGEGLITSWMYPDNPNPSPEPNVVKDYARKVKELNPKTAVRPDDETIIEVITLLARDINKAEVGLLTKEDLIETHSEIYRKTNFTKYITRDDFVRDALSYKFSAEYALRGKKNTTLAVAMSPRHIANQISIFKQRGYVFVESASYKVMDVYPSSEVSSPNLQDPDLNSILVDYIR